MKKLAILSLILFGFIALDLKAQVVEDAPPLDNFYIKENNVGKKPREYVYVREGNAYLKHRVWRMIDFRQTFNQFFYYPVQPVQDRVSFMTMVMNGLSEGSITAYDNVTDDFTKPLTYEEFMAANTNISQREVRDLDNQDSIITRSDTATFSTQDVKMLRIKEDWFFDRQRSVRDIRILGLAPVIERYNDQGDYQGVQTMFWIYYPQCRDLFTNTESFNRHNSSFRLSYDDVFAWKRFFNSYITKIDNQQDRQVNEYLQGWQLLAESNRIQTMLLNLEEDLWEY